MIHENKEKIWDLVKAAEKRKTNKQEDQQKEKRQSSSLARFGGRINKYNMISMLVLLCILVRPSECKIYRWQTNNEMVRIFNRKMVIERERIGI